MKVLIATPAHNFQIHVQMAQDVLRATHSLEAENHSVNWYSNTTSALAFARNLACQKAIDEEFDWLLFWDGDISVPQHDFIQRMTEEAFRHDADVVGLACRLKGEEYALNVHPRQPITSPTKVDAVGTGVMLIRTGLLARMTPPWFSFLDGYDEKTRLPTFSPEDYEFCVKSGATVLALPIPTIHYGYLGFTSVV